MVGPSLDRFINKGHKNILFMPKWSRLVRKYPVRISNGKNKMADTIWKLDTNSVRKMTIQILDGSVLGGLLYMNTRLVQ
jgi:hypothetical protein